MKLASSGLATRGGRARVFCQRTLLRFVLGFTLRVSVAGSSLQTSPQKGRKRTLQQVSDDHLSRDSVGLWAVLDKGLGRRRSTSTPGVLLGWMSGRRLLAFLGAVTCGSDSQI